MNFYFWKGENLEGCFVPSYVLLLIKNDLKSIKINQVLRYSCLFAHLFLKTISIKCIS